MPIARARVERFTSAIPQSASAASHVLYAKICLSKSRNGPKLWALPNIFAGRNTFDFVQIWPIFIGKTKCSGPRRQPGRQAHGSTGLAPQHHVRCPWGLTGLVKTSSTSLVRNNEGYLAFPPSVLKRFSRCPICVVIFYRITFSRNLA